MSEISSQDSEMSASVEASSLLKRLAEPAPAGSHIETLIRGVANKVGLSFIRAKKIWYKEARIISSEEMDALRIAARARDEAEGELRREYHELIARIEQLERRFDAPSSDIGGA